AGGRAGGLAPHPRHRPHPDRRAADGVPVRRGVGVREMNATDAWKPYTPTADNPWNVRKVGHLYRRAGFGATSAELQAGVADGPGKTLDRVLAGRPESDDFTRTSEFLAGE